MTPDEDEHIANLLRAAAPPARDAMFRLGVRPPESDTYPTLHNPRFNFNDDALPVGMRMFCEVTRRFLAGGQ